MTDLAINEFNIQNIMSKMTLFLGSSGSGKTLLIQDCLFKLKEQIPCIIVICPTESQNQTYCKFVPQECIIDENISPEKLIVKLNDIYQRQMKVTHIYNQANDIKFLQYLLNKMGLEPEPRIQELQHILQELKTNQLDCQQQADQLHNYDELMIQIKSDIDRVQSKLVDKYKKQIEDEILSNNDIQEQLTPSELEIANALHINPKLVLVLDDIAASLDNQVQKSEIIKKIFFQGRHSNLTCFIAVQNDKKLIPELRQQAHYVFFTDCVSLEGFQKSGGFSTKQMHTHTDVIRIYKDQHIKVLFDRCETPFKDFSFNLDQEHLIGSVSSLRHNSKNIDHLIWIKGTQQVLLVH